MMYRIRMAFWLCIFCILISHHNQRILSLQGPITPGIRKEDNFFISPTREAVSYWQLRSHFNTTGIWRELSCPSSFKEQIGICLIEYMHWRQFTHGVEICRAYCTIKESHRNPYVTDSQCILSMLQRFLDLHSPFHYSEFLSKIAQGLFIAMSFIRRILCSNGWHPHWESIESRYSLFQIFIWRPFYRSIDWVNSTNESKATL